MPARKEIFLVVGEASGDLHAALVAAGLTGDPDLRLRGAAGPRMRAAGVQADFDSEAWSAIGIAEALKGLPLLFRRGRQILALLEGERPAVLVLVDFGAFNVRLARRARRRWPTLPILYYFPPGSWNPRPRDLAWLAPLVDAVATPFDFSARMLQASGVPAAWVGHPVLDRLRPLADREAFRREHDLPPGAPVVGLMPGSRALERKLLGRVLLEAGRLIQRELPSAQCLWSVLPGRPRRPVDRQAEATPGVRVVDDSAVLLQAADVVITAMGTATLEAAAADCLPVAVYRGTGAMWLQWKLLGVHTDLYSLPNLLLGERRLPELVHREVTPERLCREVVDLWGDPAEQARRREALAQVRAKLGAPGASGRVAEMIRGLASGEAFRPEWGLPL